MKEEEILDIEILDDIEEFDTDESLFEEKEEISFEEDAKPSDDIFQDESSLFEEVPPSKTEEINFEEEKPESFSDAGFQEEPSTFEEIAPSKPEEKEEKVESFSDAGFQEEPSTFEEVAPDEADKMNFEEDQIESFDDDIEEKASKEEATETEEDPFMEAAPSPNTAESEIKFEETPKIEDLSEEKTTETEAKPIPNKEELLGKTYNLADDLKKVEEIKEEEPNEKKSMIFIAFLFAFLILFVIALPYLSRIFD